MEIILITVKVASIEQKNGYIERPNAAIFKLEITFLKLALPW